MFVTDIRDGKNTAARTGSSSQPSSPAPPWLKCAALIDPRMLIEMEVDAEL